MPEFGGIHATCAVVGKLEALAKGAGTKEARHGEERVESGEAEEGQMEVPSNRGRNFNWRGMEDAFAGEDGKAGNGKRQHGNGQTRWRSEQEGEWTRKRG